MTDITAVVDGAMSAERTGQVQETSMGLLCSLFARVFCLFRSPAAGSRHDSPMHAGRGEATPGARNTGQALCRACAGVGWIGNTVCPECEGTGRIA